MERTNMLDNLEILPGEAFTASEHIIEKVIDKISNVVGWMIMPKGSKKYQLEAEAYLVEQIKNDSRMPELAKAACISSIRKLIREYRNQHNILLIALNFLNSSANPDDVDEDWLSYFFDNAKNISKEEMAVIWGHILAREINMPNQVPKSLIYILSVIDYEDAVSFGKLANISLQIENLYYPVVFLGMSDVYRKNELHMNDIIRLESTNLIQYGEMPYEISVSSQDKIKYFDECIDVGNEEKICIGNVILTKAGQALMPVITDKRKIDGFEEFVREIILKDAGGIFDNVFEGQ